MCKTISFKTAQFFTLLACWLLASVAFGQTTSGNAIQHQKMPEASAAPIGYKSPKVEYTPNWGLAGAESTLLQYVYVNADGGEPWGVPDNPGHMNAVFGAGNWSAADFGTVNLTDLFAAATRVIWLEGGDGHGTAMAAFVAANAAAIQNWVNGGGCLFMNAATWSENIPSTFGGVVNLYGCNTTTGTIAGGQAGHPIFNGPNLPVASSWVGSSFSHGYISGPSGTALIAGECGFPVLTEKLVGSGRVLFGDLTNSYFMPCCPGNIQATNLWRNILNYLKTCNNACTPSAPTGLVVNSLTPTTATVSWTPSANCTIDQSIVQHSRKNGASWLPWVSVGVPGAATTKVLTGLSPNKIYQWRVRNHFVPSGVWIMSAAPYPQFTTPATLIGDGDGDGKGSGSGILNLVATPNPATGSTVISLGLDDFENLEQVGRLQIQSFDGRLVFEKNNLSIIELENYELDLTGFSAGIYLISVSTEKGVATQKLVVE